MREVDVLEVETNIESLRGWLGPNQLDNIRRALEEGRIDMEKYYSLSAEYVEQTFDNGGFTPRDQYLMRFADQ